MTLNVTIEPAYIPYSEEKLGNLTLMEHQSEAKNSGEKLIILDAPTSAGKTLAMLSRFVETDGNSIFVYPTNELIKDQGKGIKDLLNKIGVSSKIVPMEEDINVEDSTDIIIAVVTGESLEGLAETKGDAIKRIFHMVEGNRRMLMLTNIDTLLLLFKMQYKGGRTLLSEFLNLRYSVLAVDELHLYSGVAFANLFYLMWLLRDKFEQIIVSSATLQDSTKILQEVFDNYRVISPEIKSEPDGAHQIRHETVLALNPSNNILSRDDLDKLKADIESLFNPDKETEVNTLTIVNSVVLSEELADYMRKIYGGESIGVINGLLPSRLREQKPLTIGTSAVEVGVDFDVKNLIFEGTNAGSFIQRLGRAGRHRPGKAVAYIPTSAYRKLSDILEDNTRLTIGEIVEYSSDIIPHLRSYTNFSKSIYGAALFASILYKVEKESLTKYNPNKVYPGVKKGWEELRPPFFADNSLQGVLKNAGKSILEIISEGGARGDILSVPVYLQKHDAFSRLDILDLSRTNFYFEDVKNIDTPKPHWMKSEKVAVVKGFRDRSWIVGNWTGPLLNKSTDKILFTTTSGENTTLSLNLDDEHLERQANELLDKKIAFGTTTSELTDWRFARIYHFKYRNKCLVIGLDALVQKYVEESNV